MIQRYDWDWLKRADGIGVLYADHLASVHDLVVLCLDHGIISRGLACEYLGCAREDLDDVIKEDSNGYR